MKIGQRGFFRPWGTTGPGTPATVAGHQDTGYLSVQTANGRYVTWNPTDGTVNGDAEVAGAWERSTWDGANILLARPNAPDGPAVPYEWFNFV